MALQLIGSRPKTRDQLIAIDLGGRTTKAIHVQRKGEALSLTRYAVLDAPISDKSPSVELLTEHLRAACQALETKTRMLTLAIGLGDAIVRNTELPQMGVADMRQLLKTCTKMYLQQDLPGYVFDCSAIVSKQPSANAEKTKTGSVAKQKVLAVAAKQQLINDLQAAVKGAGLYADHVVPSLICPVNAFEAAMPDVFRQEPIALVDIGFKTSSICLLLEGEFVLSRVLTIGGDRLTAGLSESMGINYAEAEGIKIGMPSEVHEQLQAHVSPLGRELRASVEFFEHQHDRAISQVFVSGASARSDFVVKALQSELGVECRSWNPASFMQPALPPQQLAELEQIAPQLAVAVGAAVTTF